MQNGILSSEEAHTWRRKKKKKRITFHRNRIGGMSDIFFKCEVCGKRLVPVTLEGV